ncbi:MAG: ABC transporter ATP-binding protein [Clostridiales bacterium]|nr:ABC transporter ATP-binding protein [Clostridiales bacterium]
MGEDETVELLKIEGLSKTIKKKRILNGISLTVNSGEIVGFLGPNGAGKTTTIKLILGLLKIDEGKITICGHDIVTDFENAMENVGGIIENPDLYKRMTGRQNLEYFASMYKDVNKDHIDEVVRLVKMSERIDDRVKTYSLGMCQRVGIAQALLHRPRLLVLDEPTNGLDPLGIKELRDLLKYLAKEAGIGVFVSSHLLSEMELMCDRIYIIDNGEIIGEKSINQIDDSEEAPVYQYVFVTDNNEMTYEYMKSLDINCELKSDGVEIVMKSSEIPNIVKALVNNDIGIYAVNQKRRSLEQDFISITTGSKTQIR